MRRFGLPLRTVIGTATVGAAIYGLSGTLGYVPAGWGQAGLPATALGFVYLRALLVMGLTQLVPSPLGVRLAGRVSERGPTVLFALLLLAAAFVIAMT